MFVLRLSVPYSKVMLIFMYFHVSNELMNTKQFCQECYIFDKKKIIVGLFKVITVVVIVCLYKVAIVWAWLL